MKKIICILMLVLSLGLAACGKDDSGKELKTVDMSLLCDAMLAADSTLPEMITVSDSNEDGASLFQYITESFDYSKVEHYFLSYSAEGKADEIVVIAVKDTADIDEAVEALNAHKKHRISMFEQYDPDNVTRVQNGIIFKNSQYAVLIITDNAEDVKAAFEKEITKQN